MESGQVKVLSAQNDVITPDLPYHGKTTGIDTTLLAQDIIKILLDSLHLQRVSVAGLSMGASVAQDFIIAYPKRVNKAVLISAGINGYEKVHAIDSISMNWYQQFSKALGEKDTVMAAKELRKRGLKEYTAVAIARQARFQSMCIKQPSLTCGSIKWPAGHCFKTSRRPSKA